MSDAYKELKKELDEDEVIEGISFGDWGWGGYHEPDPPPVPKDKRGITLSEKEARPFMKGWKLYCGYGAPLAYAMYVWTNKRVMWITQYDGSTNIDSMPRHPSNCEVDMPGG